MTFYQPAHLPLDHSCLLDQAIRFRRLADEDVWMRPLLLELAEGYEAEARRAQDLPVTASPPEANAT